MLSLAYSKGPHYDQFIALLEHRLDDEDNEGRKSIYQNSLRQGPVDDRGTGEHLGR